MNGRHFWKGEESQDGKRGRETAWGADAFGVRITELTGPPFHCYGRPMT